MRQQVRFCMFVPGSVRYVVSQPWPFPRSLVIGFIAQARLAELSARVV